MIISIHNEVFEDTIHHKYGKVKYKISYPRLTYPIKSEAEGKINSELFRVALSVRSFARSIADEGLNNKKYNQADISFEIRCSYNEGIFLSFPAEAVICLDKDKTETFYFARNYKTSSAKPVTFDMLIKYGTPLPGLYHRICGLHHEIMNDISYEEFIRHYRSYNFYLEPSRAVLFFPPGSVKKENEGYTLLPLPYRSIKDILGYRM